MTDYCSLCGKKLGLLSVKYKSEDGSVMCASCLKEHEMKHHENKEVYIIKKEDGKLNTYRLNHVAPLLEDLNLKRGLTYDPLRTYSLLKLKRS